MYAAEDTYGITKFTVWNTRGDCEGFAKYIVLREAARAGVLSASDWTTKSQRRHPGRDPSPGCVSCPTPMKPANG